MLVLVEALVGTVAQASCQVLVEAKVEEEVVQILEYKLTEVLAQQTLVVVSEEALAERLDKEHPVKFRVGLQVDLQEVLLGLGYGVVPTLVARGDQP